MGKKKKKQIKPWCYYCEREFDEEKILIQHQKARHFKCHVCHKKLSTAGGLVIHILQVHKENITKVPNAKPGRDSVELEIYGMDGIPADELSSRYGDDDEQPTKMAKVEIPSSGIVTTSVPMAYGMNSQTLYASSSPNLHRPSIPSPVPRPPVSSWANPPQTLPITAPFQTKPRVPWQPPVRPAQPQMMPGAPPSRPLFPIQTAAQSHPPSSPAPPPGTPQSIHPSPTQSPSLQPYQQRPAYPPRPHEAPPGVHPGGPPSVLPPGAPLGGGALPHRIPHPFHSPPGVVPPAHRFHLAQPQPPSVLSSQPQPPGIQSPAPPYPYPPSTHPPGQPQSLKPSPPAPSSNPPLFPISTQPAPSASPTPVFPILPPNQPLFPITDSAPPPPPITPPPNAVEVQASTDSTPPLPTPPVPPPLGPTPAAVPPPPRPASNEIYLVWNDEQMSMEEKRATLPKYQISENA